MPGITEDVGPFGVRIVTIRAAAVKVGRSYWLDVLAGFETPRTILGEARHCDLRGHIGFETRWRWEPRRTPGAAGDARSD